MGTTAPPTEPNTSATQTIERPAEQTAVLEALLPRPVPQRHELQT